MIRIALISTAAVAALLGSATLALAVPIPLHHGGSMHASAMTSVSRKSRHKSSDSMKSSANTGQSQGSVSSNRMGY